MPELKVNHTATSDASRIEKMLDLQEEVTLDHHLWLEPVQVPRVSFSMLYNDTHIWIKYFVHESERRALVHETNGPVWQDSCVEFFISLDKGDSYFNFECNSIGTRLAGYGKPKPERRLLPVETVEKISTKVEIRKSVRGSVQWDILVAIPLSIFDQDESFSLRGTRCLANFYKCGDALEDPHFLSWNFIDSDVPNFHLPGYFGEVIFM